MFYPDLVNSIETYKRLIFDFYEEHILHKFLDSDFVVDVYIDIPPNNRVWIVDFNPWTSKTDSLMFTWDELMNGENEFEIRYVRNFKIW